MLIVQFISHHHVLVVKPVIACLVAPDQLKEYRQQKIKRSLPPTDLWLIAHGE